AVRAVAIGAVLPPIACNGIIRAVRRRCGAGDDHRDYGKERFHRRKCLEPSGSHEISTPLMAILRTRCALLGAFWPRASGQEHPLHILACEEMGRRLGSIAKMSDTPASARNRRSIVEQLRRSQIYR